MQPIGQRIMGFDVLSPGPLTLVQDAGRVGWQHLGISPSGPADMHAAAWVNRLLGNPWGAPLLEIALGGLQLRAHLDTWVALCGAEMPIQLDGIAQANWSRFAVRAGQVLRVGFARSGQRAYLAVVGGLQLATHLGSVACQVREGLGGLNGSGQALRAGDWLPCHPAHLPRAVSVAPRYRPDYRSPLLARVILGGDAEAFNAEARQQFFAQDWRLSPQSDRMGARLLGEPISSPRRQWSLGVSSGAIQVPPDGLPIILMADRQTMGGYPLLGWLHPCDLWRLAQCAAHQLVRFQPVELAQAQSELRQFYQFFRGS